MVDVVSGSHHHLKGRDQLTAGRTVPRHPEEPAEGKRATSRPSVWTHSRYISAEGVKRGKEHKRSWKESQMWLDRAKNTVLK